MKAALFALVSTATAATAATFVQYNLTETAVVSDIATTIVTITSCGDHKCTETPIATGVTTVTVTDHELTTEIVTYCPLPETSAPASNFTVPVVPVPSAPTTSELPSAPPAPPAPTAPIASSVSSVPGNISSNTSYSSIVVGGANKKSFGLASLAVGIAMLLI